MHTYMVAVALLLQLVALAGQQTCIGSKFHES